MKMNNILKNCLGLTILGLSSCQTIPSALSEPSRFSELPLNQSKVIAIASPYGENKYNLLVVEQISSKKQCWAEKGQDPIEVVPLLTKFDFTGICSRATDSNGYSIRIAGEDYGLDVLLKVVHAENELVLVGVNRKTGEEIIVGRTKGYSPGGFFKIQLEQGWHFTKRAFKGKKLGHFYFSKNSNLEFSNVESSPAPTTPAKPKTTKKTKSKN